MVKRLFDVGNCAADHGSICDLVERQFGAEVVQAHSAAEALAALRASVARASAHGNQSFDLVLINRVFDRDGDDGIELIRAIKADDKLAAVPTMLITNYPNYAQQAVASGAAPGFGKRELRSAQTVERLKAYLG